MAQFLIRRRRTPSARFGARRLPDALNRLDALRTDTRLSPYSYREIIEWAQRFTLQAKDVPYLILAKTHGWPLATVDAGLVRAYELYGVERLRFN